MKKKYIIILLLLAIVALGFIAGNAIAYFVDADSAVNKIQIGNVDLTIVEEHWEEPDIVSPEEVIRKDPAVKNTGTTDEFVVLVVKVPCVRTSTHDEIGIQTAEQATLMLDYEINDGWVLVQPPTDTNEAVSGLPSEYDAYYVQFVYAYARDGEMTSIAPGESSPALFDYIEVANLISPDFNGCSLSLPITAYGIQTENVLDNTRYTGNNADGVVTVNDIWTIVEANNAQNTGSVSAPGGSDGDDNDG